MSPPSVRPLRDVLAAGAKAARQRQGLRQEEAAVRLRGQGLVSWLRGTVAQAETGSRRLSLEEILLLALVYETSPVELLVGDDDEWVELAPDARLTMGSVRRLLSGTAETVHNLDPQTVDVPARRSAKSRRSGRFPDLLAEARRFGIRRHADVDRALEQIGDAERHAARKLGTTPERINLAAFARWGRSLAEERDHRVDEQTGGEAPPRGLQALRGHVTRELLTEIEAGLRQKGFI